MAAQDVSFKGYGCLFYPSAFFITYGGKRLGFGKVSVLAVNYDSMSTALDAPGDLIFTNSDGTSVTLQNIYCVKSTVALNDSAGLPSIYTLILTDAKRFWNKNYITARYNVQFGDASDFYDSTKSGGNPYTRAQILSAINAEGNITAASYANNLNAEVIEPMNVVFDQLGCLTALQSILDECQGYFAYDTVNNAIKLINYGSANAATSTKITENAGYLDAEFSAGDMAVKKEGAIVPASVDVVFSIYDTIQESDFNEAVNRIYAISSTTGRPAAFNAGAKHTIYAQDLKMVRDAGTFARNAEMISEANQRAEDYYGRFTAGSDYIYTRAIDFGIDEVVTGIMWEATDGTERLPMSTYIRTYNFDPFLMDTSKLAVEKIVTETLFCEVNNTNTRIILKSGGEANIRSQCLEVAAVDGLVTIDAKETPAGDYFIELNDDPINFQTFKEAGDFLNASMFCNGIRYEQIASADAPVPAVGEWALDTTDTTETYLFRIAAVASGYTEICQMIMEGVRR